MNTITKHHTGTGPHDGTGLRTLCGHSLGNNDGHIAVWSLNGRDPGACGDCLAALMPPRHRRALAGLEDGDAIAALRARLTGYVGGKHRRATVAA